MLECEGCGEDWLCGGGGGLGECRRWWLGGFDCGEVVGG